jgi:hypothetical protein
VNAVKNYLPTAVYGIFAYAFLLLLSLFLAAVVWAHWVSGKLYICTDPLFTILDIIPPFIHRGSDDAYLVPAWRVWLVWGVLMAAASTIPAIVIRYVWRRDRNNDT